MIRQKPLLLLPVLLVLFRTSTCSLQGKYEGQCKADGMYYHTETSFVYCVGGRPTIQQCPAGTHNPSFEAYSAARQQQRSLLCALDVLISSPGTDNFVASSSASSPSSSFHSQRSSQSSEQTQDNNNGGNEDEQIALPGPPPTRPPRQEFDSTQPSERQEKSSGSNGNNNGNNWEQSSSPSSQPAKNNFPVPEQERFRDQSQGQVQDQSQDQVQRQFQEQGQSPSRGFKIINEVLVTSGTWPASPRRPGDPAPNIQAESGTSSSSQSQQPQSQSQFQPNPAAASSASSSSALLPVSSSLQQPEGKEQSNGPVQQQQQQLHPNNSPPSQVPIAQQVSSASSPVDLPVARSVDQHNNQLNGGAAGAPSPVFHQLPTHQQSSTDSNNWSPVAASAGVGDATNQQLGSAGPASVAASAPGGVPHEGEEGRAVYYVPSDQRLDALLARHYSVMVAQTPMAQPEYFFPWHRFWGPPPPYPFLPFR